MTESGHGDPELLARVDHSAVAAFAAEAWGVAADTVRFVGQSANAIFRAERDGSGVYLRLVHEAGSRGIDNIAAVQEFQQHLGRYGAPVSRPVPSRNGSLIERFEQGPDAFLVRAEEEVPGKVFAPIDVGLDRGEQAFQELGRALARWHEASLSFLQTTDFSHYSWQSGLENIDTWLPAEDAGARGELAYVKASLEPLDPSGDGYGLTHGDMNCGNIIWDGQRATIIDFDEPMWNWFAVDIVRPMRDYRTWPLADRRRILAAIIEGYRSVRAFSDEWVAALSLFQRFKELDMYAWTSAGYTLSVDGEGRERRACYLEEQRGYFREPLEF